MKSNLSNYNLVDVNKFTEKELIEDETLISKLMLLEKSGNTKETLEYIEKIIPKIKEQEKEVMTRIIGIIFEKKIGKEKANELIKKLKGEDEEMLAVIEMIRKENQMYIDIGIKRGIKKGEKEKQINIIKNMLAEGLPISLISKITKSDEKEIEKINTNNK